MAIYADLPYGGPPSAYTKTAHPKRYVAIHNTSNDATAAEEAAYGRRRPDGISTHYYVDSGALIQMLDTALGANHAGSLTGNRHAISYEVTGVNGWAREQWLERVAWPLLARQVARDCRRHDIAPRLLTVAQMRDGVSTGLVTHDLMRLAWGGTTHTDPGPNFPIDHLLALVRAELTGEDDLPVDQSVFNALMTKAFADPNVRSQLGDAIKNIRTGFHPGDPDGRSFAELLLDAGDESDVPAADPVAIAAAIVDKLPARDAQAVADAVLAAVADRLAGGTS